MIMYKGIMEQVIKWFVFIYIMPGMKGVVKSI
jgi:hypothetical protein